MFTAGLKPATGKYNQFVSAKLLLLLLLLLLSLACVQKIISCFYTCGSALDISERKFCRNLIWHMPPRHEASTIDADPGRAGRIEQGEARPGNSAPRSGPQLELFRRRLKTCSKSEPSAAHVQTPTCVYMHLFCHGGTSTRFA